MTVFGVQRRVAGREHAAFADAEQVDLVDAVALADRRDAVRQISVDVVVEREPAVGARWVAPIHHVEVDAELEEVADERAVLLQVGHGVAADQAVDDQHRRRDLLLGERPVVVQRDLVLPPHLVLGRGGDRDVLVAQLGEQLAPRAIFSPRAAASEIACSGLM